MDTAQVQAQTAAQATATTTLDSQSENSGTIDMTPDLQPSNSTALNASSTESTNANSNSASTALATIAGTNITPQMRSDTTARHVGDVMESLDFAAVRLEGAMYRIGYLESQVDTMQEQLKVLSEFRARAAKAVLTERENAVLQERINDYEEELEETHQILEKLNNSKAWQFFRWLFGINL